MWKIQRLISALDTFHLAEIKSFRLSFKISEINAIEVLVTFRILLNFSDINISSLRSVDEVPRNIE